MTNHVHIHVDPCGFDISKFMQCLNLAYVRYINIKYKRKGHLFSERFKSKIIRDMNYNLLVSAYIHNNPADIAEYKGREYDYPYSSMGIYTGKRKDKRNIVDSEFVLSCINESNKKAAKKQYIELVAVKFEIKDPMIVMRKWEREAMEFRATLAYILNVLCGLTYSQICDIMHNITEACCTNLCKKGFGIVNKGNFEEFYSELI